MILLLMGVAGSGKTTIGRMLADALKWPFADADDYHPAENREKMRNGIPLTDEDRAPWLDRLSALMNEHSAQGGNLILACSALREAYRRKLVDERYDVRIIYLKGTPEVLERRLAGRQHSFMNAQLLESQLATLEEPSSAIVLSIEMDPQELVSEVIKQVKPS